MNFDYKENDGNKAFLTNPMHQHLGSQWGQHDCSANNKKNWDCYKYQSLPHFLGKLSL